MLLFIEKKVFGFNKIIYTKKLKVKHEKMDKNV